MDALGIPPRAAETERARTAPDLLPIYGDILFLWDFGLGLFLGFATGLVYTRYVSPGLPVEAIIAPLLREVLLGSLIAALVLREPRLGIDVELFAPRRLLARLTWRVAAAAAILLSVGLLTRGFGDVARLWVLAWCGLFILFASLSRGVLIAHLHRLSRQGHLREAVAVIGAPDVAGRIAARLAEQAAIVRVLDEPDDPYMSIAPSDAMAELVELARTGAVDTIVVALNPGETDEAAWVLQHLRSVPVQITVCADIQPHVHARSTTRMLGSVPMSVVSDRPLKRWDLIAKFALDQLGGLLLLLIGSPLMLLVAAAVACESPGPVIFRQKRSGWGGQQFTIYKFRTMRHEPGVSSPHQTERRDRRVTRVGAFLRRTSLDEMPQLWNVLRGDMSLVGPRPHADVLHEAERVGCRVVAEYAQRQRMKPGLTGWAQIHGSRGAVRTADALRKRIAYDLYYIDHWSIWLDFVILARTPKALLLGNNAY